MRRDGLPHRDGERAKAKIRDREVRWYLNWLGAHAHTRCRAFVLWRTRRAIISTIPGGHPAYGVRSLHRESIDTAISKGRMSITLGVIGAGSAGRVY